MTSNDNEILFLHRLFRQMESENTFIFWKLKKEIMNMILKISSDPGKHIYLLETKKEIMNIILKILLKKIKEVLKFINFRRKERVPKFSPINLTCDRIHDSL